MLSAALRALLLHRRLISNPQSSRFRFTSFRVSSPFSSSSSSSSSSNGSNKDQPNSSSFSSSSSWSGDWGANWGVDEPLSSSWSTGLTTDHFDGASSASAQDSIGGHRLINPESQSNTQSQPPPSARQIATAMDEEDDLARMLEADNKESKKFLDGWNDRMMTTYRLMKQVREPGVRGEYLKDSEKAEMYRLYKEDPEVNTIEKLAKDYRVMKQRVHAILWLKEMEEDDEKKCGKPLDDSVEILLDNFPE